MNKLRNELNKLVENRNKLNLLIDVVKCDIIDHMDLKYKDGDCFKSIKTEKGGIISVFIECVSVDDYMNVIYECEVTYDTTENECEFKYEVWTEAELEKYTKDFEYIPCQKDTDE